MSIITTTAITNKLAPINRETLLNLQNFVFKNGNLAILFGLRLQLFLYTPKWRMRKDFHVVCLTLLFLFFYPSYCDL